MVWVYVLKLVNITKHCFCLFLYLVGWLLNDGREMLWNRVILFVHLPKNTPKLPSPSIELFLGLIVGLVLSKHPSPSSQPCHQPTVLFFLVAGEAVKISKCYAWCIVRRKVYTWCCWRGSGLIEGDEQKHLPSHTVDGVSPIAMFMIFFWWRRWIFGMWWCYSCGNGRDRWYERFDGWIDAVVMFFG